MTLPWLLCIVTELRFIPLIKADNGGEDDYADDDGGQNGDDGFNGADDDVMKSWAGYALLPKRCMV